MNKYSFHRTFLIYNVRKKMMTDDDVHLLFNLMSGKLMLPALFAIIPPSEHETDSKHLPFFIKNLPFLTSAKIFNQARVLLAHFLNL